MSICKYLWHNSVYMLNTTEPHTHTAASLILSWAEKKRQTKRDCFQAKFRKRKERKVAGLSSHEKLIACHFRVGSQFPPLPPGSPMALQTGSEQVFPKLNPPYRMLDHRWKAHTLTKSSMSWCFCCRMRLELSSSHRRSTCLLCSTCRRCSPCRLCSSCRRCSSCFIWSSSLSHGLRSTWLRAWGQEAKCVTDGTDSDQTVKFTLSGIGLQMLSWWALVLGSHSSVDTFLFQSCGFLTSPCRDINFAAKIKKIKKIQPIMLQKSFSLGQYITLSPLPLTHTPTHTHKQHFVEFWTSISSLERTLSKKMNQAKQ